MSMFKRTQRKYVKKGYRVRNWREYEAGLRDRGSLTVWISLTDGKLVNWNAPRPRRRKPGRQRKYSNHAIETAVTLGMVFHLASRQSEGITAIVVRSAESGQRCAGSHHDLEAQGEAGQSPFLPRQADKTPLHILIDSSGLAVHVGQLRKPPKNRDYRKLHLCVDERDWRCHRLRADEQKSPRFIAGCIACRADRQSDFICKSRYCIRRQRRL